ncbi:MAG: extracellular solute-binding protein [Bacillota bacterium]
MKRSLRYLGGLTVALSLLLSACGGAANRSEGASNPAKSASQELVIYSGRKENLIQPVVAAFEKQSGVKVVLKVGGATELANLVMEERSAPRADIYLSNDAGALEKLRMESVLEPYTSERLKAVPVDLKAPDNTWHAVTVRARVIMYNKDLVSESELPARLFELADPRWKDQVGMATGANESVIANVTALRITEGEQATERFLTDLKRNGVKIFKGHSDVRRAVGRGEIKLGWVNHYYYHAQLKEKEFNNVGVIYPDQSGQGVTVNIAGAAIVKGARNMANARAFMDFLLTPETQKLFAEVNDEMPVLPGVPVAPGVRPLGEFKRNPVKLGKFGAEWDKSVRLIDKIGLVLK